MNGSLAYGTANTDVFVNGGGTLGGIGTIYGTVTAASSGTVAPGLTTGIIRTGALTLNSGSTTKIEIDGVAGAGNTTN